MKNRGRNRLFNDSQNYSGAQAHDGQSNELNSSDGGTEIQHDDNSCNSEAKKICGPTLLKDIWKLLSRKIIDVPFNNHNQAIGKEGRKLASFLGIIARTLELTPLQIDDWRNFDNEEKKKLVDFARKKFSSPKRGEAWVLKLLGKKWKDYKCSLKASYWLSDKAKRCTQANRNNRAKQTMPHTGGSKSIATLMNEQEIYERMSNSERSTEQPPRSIAWEGDVYSQVLENEKSGYVRGLGLGPTPSVLWGSRSFLGNIVADDSSNEVIQRLEHQIIELKEKQNEEMNIMK
nr:uncharacterized protein LOC104112443 [Nicotiana tomentosiformis]